MPSRLPALLALAAFATLLGVSPGSIAHDREPLEAAPRTPAAGASSETVAGELRTIVVEDRVAGQSIRYRALTLPDGSGLRIVGDDTTLPADGHVVVTGRRNGTTLFASSARQVARAADKRGRTWAHARGTLRMYYIDFESPERSRPGYEVVADDGAIVPLAMAIEPEAIDRGMRVEVEGERLDDGSIEPQTIAITALAAPEDDAGKATLKAVRTDKLLVILMRFTDSPAQPFTQAQVQAVVAGGPGSGSVAEFFKEASFGQQLVDPTVTPWLSTGAATPASCDWRAMGTLGRNAAAAAGYVLSSYQKIAYVFPRVASCGWLGLGYVGASGAWINGANTTLVIGHELGHNFGLRHAGNVDCGANVVGGSCTASEYGDPFGIMGNQRAMHVNAHQKAALGWIATTTVRTHTGGSAVYTLSPLETAGGSVYAIKVPAAANRTYWLEYRQPIGFDSAMASYPSNGALIRVASPFATLCGGCSSSSNDTQLLDTTPATSTFTDAALLAGRTLVDSQYGITFNVLSASPSGVSVQVVGPGAAVTATTTTLASSANPANAGASLQYTATVNGASPSGSVTFTANGATITGCAAVALAGSGNARTASCTTSTLAVGTHGIVARYGGDASNAASTSATLSQTINAVATGAINVALASNGATASASSTLSANYAASSLINNERKGANFGGAGGGWRDANPGVFPDWVQVDFSGSRTIDRVVVYSVQNNWTNPVEPTDTTTASVYGIRNFTVQGWSGSAWVTLATVSANTLAKRTVTFPAYTTDRIRINVTATADGWTRITEVEAWGTNSATTASNVALASNGGTASASSTLSANYAASSLINNERKGANFGGAGGGWRDANPGVFPDWVQVDFSGSRTIDRVVVYSVQNNWTNPIEPTDTTTASVYGIRNFTVQGWSGSAWVTLATVSANTLAKRTVTFPAHTTDRIRINVTATADGWTRITEVEAWGR